MKIIYSLIGNFPSRQYDLIEWYNPDGKQKYKFPLSILAYAKELKRKGEEYRIVFLVPHSIFIGTVNNLEELKNSHKLRKIYENDISNYYSNRLKFLINRIRIAKNKDLFTDSTGKLINFLKNIEEIDAGLLKILEDFKEVEQIEEIKEAKEEFAKEWEKLREKIGEVLINKDKELQEIINHTNTEIIIIPSLGTYNSKSKVEINYKISYSQRVLNLFLIFIKDILEHLDNNTHFILDISTGLNALVIEAVEAFYNANVFSNFFFLGEYSKHVFSIFSAEPVIGADTTTPKAYTLEDIKKIAFFKKPFTHLEKEDYINSLPEKIKKRFRRELNNIIEQAIFLFNILYYNTPLCITLPAYDEVRIRLRTFENFLYSIKNFVQELSKELQIVLENNAVKLKPSSDFKKLYFKKVRNLLFMLALGANLTKAFERIKLIKENGEVPEQLEILECNNYKRIYALSEKFKNVLVLYKKYNLTSNGIFLIQEIRNKIKRIKQKSEELKNNNCIKVDDSESNKKEEIRFKRNFLAHCGFEGNSTLLCKRGDKIYLKYDENTVKDIYRIIVEEVDIDDNNEYLEELIRELERKKFRCL